MYRAVCLDNDFVMCEKLGKVPDLWEGKVSGSILEPVWKVKFQENDKKLHFVN